VLKGKDRFCDVCGAATVEGEKYAIVTVSKENAELFDALTESGPPTWLLRSLSILMAMFGWIFA
jgi:hypothetical protein